MKKPELKEPAIKRKRLEIDDAELLDSRPQTRPQTCPQTCPQTRLLTGTIQTCGFALDQFLSIDMVLALRGCTNGLTKLYHPKTSYRLWDRIKPQLKEFLTHVHVMSDTCADLFSELYYGEQKVEYEDFIEQTACICGNLQLVQRYWAKDSTNNFITSSFDVSLKHGNTDIAVWILENPAVSGFTPDVTTLSYVSHSGNIELAKQMLGVHEDETKNSNAIETNEGKRTWSRQMIGDVCGFNLFKDSCERGHYEYATWVMSIFPISPSIGQLREIMRYHPLAIPFIVNTFELQSGDLFKLYLVVDNYVSEEQSPVYKNKLNRCLDWMRERYDEEHDSDADVASEREDND